MRILLVMFLAAAIPCAEPPSPQDPHASHSLGHSCPCSVFARNTIPTFHFANEGKPIEVGTVFHTGVSGFATAIRFLKGSESTGLHVGHLWNERGDILASVTFRGESATGWQEAALVPPVALQPDMNYVVSYFSPTGSYAYTADYLKSDMRGPVLTVPAEGGRFLYAPRPGFPVSTYMATSYWVDLLFSETVPREAPLSLAPEFPQPEESGVATWPRLSAIFSRPMLPDTINNSSVRLIDSRNRPVPSQVVYRAATREIFLRPLEALSFQTAYSIQLSEGKLAARDVSGETLGQPMQWSFHTGADAHAQATPNGPIVVLTSAAHPFSTYLPEILRAEGLNEFRAVAIEGLSTELLKPFTIAVLGDIPVTDSQMEILSAWVRSGRKLIAMRPDRRYDAFYGIRHQASEIADAYFKIDSSLSPGAGLTGGPIQFHGTSDVYDLAGGVALARLCANAKHATAYPAVSWFRQGKGMSATFSFDLARSIVLTRQGNPEWSGMERDGVAPIRSDDLFYGSFSAGNASAENMSAANTSAANTREWLDFSNVQIPQADVLQQLFANLILELTKTDQPLPRFWYLPRGLKAAVVMTGDDHGKGNTVNRFENALAASAPNCSLEQWECVRGSAYLFPGSLTREQANKYAADGFDIGVHVSTECLDWPSQSSKTEMAKIYRRQISDFAKSFPELNRPSTSRTHCIAWGDYDTQPRVESEAGIRLDTNYYYWPQEWIKDRPGLFTGSGMPMRFSTRAGNPIDVYQAPTFLTDESGQTYPLHIDVLLDNALGPQGYFGAFTANMHADLPESPQAEAILGSALGHNVPVISAKQLLDWVEARDGSWFENEVWSGGKLAFSVAAAAGAYGLQAMLPSHSSAGQMIALTRDDRPVSYASKEIKGIKYCAFSATSGRYEATYRP